MDGKQRVNRAKGLKARDGATRLDKYFLAWKDILNGGRDIFQFYRSQGAGINGFWDV